MCNFVHTPSTEILVSQVTYNYLVVMETVPLKTFKAESTASADISTDGGGQTNFLLSVVDETDNPSPDTFVDFSSKGTGSGGQWVICLGGGGGVGFIGTAGFGGRAGLGVPGESGLFSGETLCGDDEHSPFWSLNIPWN